MNILKAALGKKKICLEVQENPEKKEEKYKISEIIITQKTNGNGKQTFFF